MLAAARTMGIELRLVNASTPDEINAAFATIAQLHSDGLLVGSDPFFTIQREQIVGLATILRCGPFIHSVNLSPPVVWLAMGRKSPMHTDRWGSTRSEFLRVTSPPTFPSCSQRRSNL